MIATLQRIAASTIRIERRSVEPLFILRCSLGVATSLIAGYATGQPLYAVAAAIGALSTGFASLQGVYRTRAATMLAMALAMGFSAAAGMLTAHSFILSLVALAVWGFAYGIFASLGAPAAAVGLNATIALIVFEHLPASGATAVATALWVVGGGVLQTLLLVVLWPIQRYPLERAAMAQAYRALAAYARALDPSNPVIPPTAELRIVRATLADPRPFGRNAAAAAFTTLLTEAERIRASLAGFTSHDSGAFDAFRGDVADALEAIAFALEHATAPDNDALKARLEAGSDDPSIRMLLGQMRAAWRSSSVPLRGLGLGKATFLRALFPDNEEARATLRSAISLDSPFGRHAVRLSVVLVLCGLVGHFFGWQRGYWATLTAAIVLRPDFNTTLSRGFARIIGTVVGVVLSTALVLIVPDTPHVSLVLAIVFATIGYAVFQMNFALYSLTVTAYVVFLLALAGQPEQAAIVNRLLATLCGGAIAMISYVVWPTWESEQARQRLIDLLGGLKAYDRTLFEGLADSAERNVRAANALRFKVWDLRAAAQESIERMLSEPPSTHDLDADFTVAFSAATMRIGVAHVAFASQYAQADFPAYPEVAPFAEVASGAFETAINALGRHGAPAANEPLRDAYAALAKAIPANRAGREAFLANADLLVDGLNTCSDLLRTSA